MPPTVRSHRRIGQPTGCAGLALLALHRWAAEVPPASWQNSPDAPFFVAPRVVGGIRREDSRDLFRRYCEAGPDTMATRWARGKADIIASRQAYPGRPARFEVHRSAGTAAVQVVELTLRFDGGDPHPVVAVLDLRDGHVTRERIYIADPWDPPEYRARWVEPLNPG